jgi:HlyD family secretion protein
MRHTPKAFICVSAIVILSLLAGCRQDPAPTPTPGGATVAVASGANAQVGDTIRALGTVRPAQTLALSFGTGGPVQAISARVGTVVHAGDVLAELDSTALALELESAEQLAAYWQATLDGLHAGASPAQIERAETTHAQQVVEAELALQIAQQRLAQARRQSSDADVIAARSALQQLETQLAQSRALSPDAQVAIAQVDLERARDVLAAAQDEYGKALDRPWEPQEIRDALAKEVQRAKWNLQVAQAQLEDAERAQHAHALGVEALGTQRAALQAQLDRALAAQASYSDTLSILSTEVSLAQARLEALQSWQNPLLDPPLPAQVAQVEAQLRQAQLAVEQLEWQIARAVLCAPFAGVVGAVHARPGEWVAPGAPVLDLVDTSSWIVETRNVSELTIGQVRVGQRALVEVLALDRAEIGGTVDTISPVAVVQQGDTTYTLMVALDVTDLPLRSGMNAQVQIELD